MFPHRNMSALGEADYRVLPQRPARPMKGRFAPMNGDPFIVRTQRGAGPSRPIRAVVVSDALPKSSNGLSVNDVFGGWGVMARFPEFEGLVFPGS